MEVMDEENEFEGMSAEELLQLGADRFNAKQFFEAHEAWEEVWLDSERELRHFYQGLIQVAAAFVHLQRNEYPGTVKLLHEGLRKIEAYPPITLGVDLASLAKASREVETRVLEVGERRLREIDITTLPQVKLCRDAAG
jgi:predicted metal-dependent hydrolase